MRHYIYRFRRSLEPIFKHQLIEYTANGYRLNPNINVMTDLQKFDRLYRTETRTGTTSYTDPDTGETVTEEYEYEVQVPYTYYICTVELENFNLSHVPVYIMSHDQLSMYATYMSTLGNRPGLFPDSSYVDAYYNTEYEVYEIPPEALADPQFAAMIEEAEKYLGYPYVWGGSSPSTSFDCSGFVSYVLNNCGVGWDIGRLGASGLLGICTRVSSANVQPGDLIFFEGTYDTTGACLRSALKVRMVVVDRFDIEQVKGYTIMPNYHQRDRTLSIKAKGILSQMFSLPEGWDYTLRGLAYLNIDGIDSMRSGIRELERAGYIERRRTRDEHGKLRGTVYKVYAVPRKPTSNAPTLENALVLQAQSQLKALYKDNADTIIGNMDSRIFLGGSEPTTLKELNQSLGKETIDTFNTGESRGREVSHSLNYQKLGKDLATIDELAVLDGGKCILQLRGVRPFMSNKFDITKHPHYKYLSDADSKNNFDIEKYLSTQLRTKPDDVYHVYEVDASEVPTTA